MSRYKIIPANGTAEYVVEGDRYEFDKVNRSHTIYSGEEPVASLINVSVVKLPDSPPTDTPPSPQS